MPEKSALLSVAQSSSAANEDLAMFLRAISCALLAACIGCGGDEAASVKSTRSATAAKNVVAASEFDVERRAFREPMEHNREAYPVIAENDFLSAQQNPLSTF